MTNDYQQQIAEQLINIKAVGFVDEPITFKSGIKSPVYIDNRKLPFYPQAWKVVLAGFQQLIQDLKLDYDVVAGIETAGIPHSATLGYLQQKPSVFIRKAQKDHGTKKMIEGGLVDDKKVLLIEDHLTTGSSSLHGVNAIIQARGQVAACLAITSYEFAEATAAFAQAQVDVHTLTTFSHILDQALRSGQITEAIRHRVESWLSDPHGWEI